jgi:signal transduction histidine kinase
MARALLVFTFALWLAIAPARAGESVLHLDRAGFMLSDAVLPPPADAPWSPQALPDLWRQSRPGIAQTSGWYRLRFEVSHGLDEPHAIYIALTRPAADVFVNDLLIGRTGLPDRPQNATHPQYLGIPPDALHAGTNEVYVHLRGAGTHGLTAVTVGRDVDVRPLYESRYFWQVTGVQFCSLSAAIWGCFALLLWLRQRKERMYLYWGLSALCWTIYTADSILRFAPLPNPWWDAVFALGAFGKLFMMALFAACYAGVARPWVERGLWTAFALTMAVVWAGTFDLNAWLGGFVWNYVVFPVLAGYVALFVTLAWRQRSWESVLLALAASIHLVDGFYQYLLGHPFGQLALDYYDFLPLNLILVWILIDRFIRALDEARRLNAELEGRVAQKHAELQHNFAQLRELERQQAVAEERRRIMSDMHDGIGGQLISTLSLVEASDASKEQVATALRECIDDLRLAIDSLEPTEEDLLPVLGGLRYRLEPRLKAQGIALDWRVQEVPKLACLTPQNVLHILRILQEAFTNVLKHAHADRVAVEAGVEPDSRRVYIRVSDNGRGLASSDGPRPQGHGLVNMLRRAKALGGELLVRPSSGRGTTLELLLPVG